MNIKDLIKKKIYAIDVYLKYSADQLRDSRELTINEEYKLVNKRYNALKSKRKLQNELSLLEYDTWDGVFNN